MVMISTTSISLHFLRSPLGISGILFLNSQNLHVCSQMCSCAFFLVASPFPPGKPISPTFAQCVLHAFVSHSHSNVVFLQYPDFNVWLSFFIISILVSQSSKHRFFFLQTVCILWSLPLSLFHVQKHPDANGMKCLQLSQLKSDMFRQSGLLSLTTVRSHLDMESTPTKVLQQSTARAPNIKTVSQVQRLVL